MFERVIAIDWSGRKDAAGQRRAIQRCVVEMQPSPRVSLLEGGLTRSEVTAWLCKDHFRDALVGFDFAFSFPAPYPDCVGRATSWLGVLEWAAEHSEDALSACQAPFWGRPGKRRGQGGAVVRRCDAVAAAGLSHAPKPIFQIGGAGAVGTGSLRGMPQLLTLREAGFHCWPFDGPPQAGASSVVEIYPRWFTGNVVKSNRDARDAYLRRYLPRDGVEVQDRFRLAALTSEDAFDALVSAVGIAELLLDGGFERYGSAFYADEVLRAEGWILGPTPVP
jgi:hypothetical protein